MLLCRKNLVIFDVDGTLLDTHTATIDAARVALVESGGPLLEAEELAPVLALNNLEAARMLGASNPYLFEERAIYHYNRLSERHVHVFTGVKDCLETLVRTGRKIAIATSRISRELLPDLEKHGLSGYFSCTVCADDVARFKPDPAPLLLVLEKMGIASEETIYIGDLDVDWHAAQAADIDFVHAAWSGHAVSAACVALSSPLDLISLLCP